MDCYCSRSGLAASIFIRHPSPNDNLSKLWATVCLWKWACILSSSGFVLTRRLHGPCLCQISPVFTHWQQRASVISYMVVLIDLLWTLVAFYYFWQMLFLKWITIRELTLKWKASIHIKMNVKLTYSGVLVQQSETLSQGLLQCIIWFMVKTDVQQGTFILSFYPIFRANHLLKRGSNHN